MPASLKTRSVKSLVWSVGESAGIVLLSLGAFIVMARVLQPQDFGVVALASAIIMIANLVVGHSFTDVLVQRRELDPEHLDTAFWSVLTIALGIAAACIFAAQALAAAVGESGVAQVLPALSIVLLCTALGGVPTALARRDMRFRPLALCAVSGRALGSIVGIAMALAGFRFWSLVGQQVVTSLVSSIAVMVAIGWRPRFTFSVSRLRQMGHFGFHVSATQVIGGLGEQLMSIVVGTLFGSVVLGFFSVSWRMVQLVRSLVSSAVYHVGLSAFSRLQDDKPAMAHALLHATQLSCLVGFPLGAGIVLVAEPAINVLFGPKWADSATLLGILALEIVPAFYGMFITAGYRALGRPGLVLILASLTTLVGFAGMLAVSPWGITAVAAFWVAKTVAFLPLHVVLMSRLLDVPKRAFAAPVLAPLAATLAMSVAVYALLSLLGDRVDDLSSLLIASAVGPTVYGAALWLLSPALVRVALDTARIMVTPMRRADPARPAEAGATP